MFLFLNSDFKNLRVYFLAFFWAFFWGVFLGQIWKLAFFLWRFLGVFILGVFFLICRRFFLRFFGAFFGRFFRKIKKTPSWLPLPPPRAPQGAVSGAHSNPPLTGHRLLLSRLVRALPIASESQLQAMLDVFDPRVYKIHSRLKINPAFFFWDAKNRNYTKNWPTKKSGSFFFSFRNLC